MNLALKVFIFSVRDFSQNLFIIPGIIAISSIGLAFQLTILEKENKSKEQCFYI